MYKGLQYRAASNLINDFIENKDVFVKGLTGGQTVAKKSKNLKNDKEEDKYNGKVSYKQMYDIKENVLIYNPKYFQIVENYIKSKKKPSNKNNKKEHYDYYQTLTRHLEENSLAEKHNFTLIDGNNLNKKLKNEKYFIFRPYGDDPTNRFYNHAVLLRREGDKILVCDTLKATRNESLKKAQDIFGEANVQEGSFYLNKTVQDEDRLIDQKSWQGCFEIVLLAALRLREMDNRLKMITVNNKLNNIENQFQEVDKNFSSFTENIKNKGVNINDKFNEKFENCVKKCKSEFKKLKKYDNIDSQETITELKKHLKEFVDKMKTFNSIENKLNELKDVVLSRNLKGELNKIKAQTYRLRGIISELDEFKKTITKIQKDKQKSIEQYNKTIKTFSNNIKLCENSLGTKEKKIHELARKELRFKNNLSNFLKNRANNTKQHSGRY